MKNLKKIAKKNEHMLSNYVKSAKIENVRINFEIFDNLLIDYVSGVIVKKNNGSIYIIAEDSLEAYFIPKRYAPTQFNIGDFIVIEAKHDFTGSLIHFELNFETVEEPKFIKKRNW